MKTLLWILLALNLVMLILTGRGGFALGAFGFALGLLPPDRDRP